MSDSAQPVDIAEAIAGALSIQRMPDRPQLRGETIGERIREAYLASGFNRHSFAREAGISYQAIWNWERGSKAPLQESLEKVAAATGYTVEELRGSVSPPVSQQDPATREAVEAFLSGPRGEMVTDREAELLRTLPSLGEIDPTREVIESIWMAIHLRGTGG